MTLRLAVLAILAGAAAPGVAKPIPPSFTSTGADRAAIQVLLDTFTKAVSTKNQALFETLLLSTDIPFSGIPLHTQDLSTHDYQGFRRGVFDGASFTQSFRDVHVNQDGALAQVSLVYVNQAADGTSWGWKTLQLLKVKGSWKIASEFYTGHPG